MLHKCANPSCNAPFRSLREGKLFLAETFPAGSNATPERRKLRRREHFWLCDTCAVHYTLHFDPSSGMLTVPLNNRESPCSLALAAARAS